MIKNTLPFLLLLFSCGFSFSQSIESVSGHVVNTHGQGLFGNAIILSHKDSSIIQGTPFFDGAFTLSDFKHHQLLLKLTSLEFQDTLLVLKYNGMAQINLGDIVVKESFQELDEVMITAKSSLIKQKPDGSIEVKVANSALATSTSVNEILSKSPGVIVDNSDVVNIFGKGAAIIFINGIRVSNDRLSTLPPSNIESIQIISNPGPRYDAEGNAVINIVTKSNVTEGSKGMVKNALSNTDFSGFQNRTDINYNYTKDKWALNSNYGLITGENRHILETTRIRNRNEDYFRSHLITDNDYKLENESNYGIGGQYNFNSNHYISLQYTGAYENLGGEQRSRNEITNNTQGVYKSIVHLDNQTLKNNYSGNYYMEADTLGSNLFLGAQYSSYQYDFNNNIDQISTEENIENNALINNIGTNSTNIFSVQADYTHVFTKKNMLEFGAKFSRATIESNTDFFDIIEGGKNVKDIDISNSFNYDERVPTVYFNFKGSINSKINYSFGLRSEYTDYTLNTSIDNGKKIENSYLNIFPNASLSSQLSQEANIYLTYSSRIIRAPYNRLNPFVIYQDAFTSIQGNPDLKPSLVQSMELGGLYKGWGLKATYSYTKDPIDGGAFQSETDPNVYILKRTNLSIGHLYSATLSKNLNFNFWRSINTASVSYSKLFDDAQRYAISNNKPFYYLYSQNSFDINDWFTVYLTAWYLSNKQDGINNEKDLSTVNIGLEKKLFQDKLIFNLDFNDIFHEVRYDGEYTLGITDIVYANTVNTNYFRFSLTYNFGKLKQLKYKNKSVGESESQRAQ